MTSETIIEVVEKLVGDIHAYGECYHDEMAYENLGVLGEVVDSLTYSIIEELDEIKRFEGSREANGEQAKSILESLKESIDCALEGVQE